MGYQAPNFGANAVFQGSGERRLIAKAGLAIATSIRAILTAEADSGHIFPVLMCQLDDVR
jgi:hypothetical protein